jgi:hypothetical protein
MNRRGLNLLAVSEVSLFRPPSSIGATVIAVVGRGAVSGRLRCVALLLALALLLPARSGLAEDGAPEGLLCLIAAYPDHLDKAAPDPAGGWQLVWKDGSRMPWDDGRAKTHKEKLDSPDLEDQMSQAYPTGKLPRHPAMDDDPGRIRYEPLFAKMYGDSEKVVRVRLGNVRWLPRTISRVLKANRINGVDKALTAVSEELDALSPGLRKFVVEVSGPFNWRPVKGTSRLSPHSYAVAIDVGVKYSDYWRWHRTGKDGGVEYRNKIPYEIVEIFERHGFIWGGKWYHYDTMHFEYRPELLNPACTRKSK